MRRYILAMAVLVMMGLRCAPAAAPSAPPTPAPSAPPTPAPAPKAPAYADALAKDVPHVKQKPGFAGEACAEMGLAHLGSKLDQDDVFNAAGVDPMLGRGCAPRELAGALRRIGLKTGDGESRIAAAKAGEEVETQWAALHADLIRGIPSIVSMRRDADPKAAECFRLVFGYDKKADELMYHDPALDGGAMQRMKRRTFLDLWPLKYERENWTAVRIRLEPGDLKGPAHPAGFTSADYAQHVMALKKKLPAGFAMVLESPFVVAGDDPPAVVKQRAKSTVRWSVDRLKAEYFAKDPAEIIDVWLFKNDASYRKYTKEVFGDAPDTPFGYYSGQHGALIMNIATGGGTLVHEIVHPFMRANFPACPAWFNEGMGSLYEQCEDKDGHIHGRTNWRLAGLQKAIQAGQLLSFQDLTATTENQFYSRDKGANYSQARYLCYYLQENGLLAKFYRDFTAGQKDDPTGYKTLKSVLGERDMAAFQKRWEAWVLKLTFP